MLTGMHESVRAWGEGGRVLWIGLVLTIFFMLRASKSHPKVGVAVVSLTNSIDPSYGRGAASVPEYSHEELNISLEK